MARSGFWLGLWTLLGLVFATQLYLAEARASAHPSTWGQALRSELPDWYLWGGLALLVRWLSRRFRIDRASWERTVPIHFGSSLTLGFAHVVLATAPRWSRRATTPAPPKPSGCAPPGSRLASPRRDSRR